MKSGAHVLVSGRVQGVYFRANTQAMAKSLGLVGWVRNLPDGRVEAIFEGEEEEIEDMVSWCRRGPADAKVSSVEVERRDYSGKYSGFEITL